MTTNHNPRSPQEVALIQAQLQMLADNPGLIQRMKGRRELDGLAGLPSDSRRPTDTRSTDLYVVDNSVYGRDQDANYSAGLL